MNAFSHNYPFFFLMLVVMGLIVGGVVVYVAFLFVMDWIDGHVIYDVSTLLDVVEQVEAERFDLAQRDLDDLQVLAAETIAATFMKQSW